MSTDLKTAQSPAPLKTAPPPVSAIPTQRPAETLAVFPKPSNTTSSAIPTTQHHAKGTANGIQKQPIAVTTSGSIQVDITSKSSVTSASQNESKPVTSDLPKEKPVRKKRGQYKKTILRQQAEAIETARAAGLPIPVFPPLDSAKSSKNTEKQSEASKEPEQHREPSSNATVEHLNIRSSKLTYDRTDERAAMERELAMLQEEADEDLKKRELDTNRALMRAQVVNVSEIYFISVENKNNFTLLRIY